MTLPGIFQISIYSLTALSGLMLAYGEEEPFPSGVTPLLCLVALFVNERHRLFRLDRLWSNVLGLAALGVTVFEFSRDRADARLVAGAHFLVYLIWIVLFQQKQAQQYWWLFALGLLQVAVGTVMTLSGWYGLLMLVYLLLALWTMAVFHLYQGAISFGAKTGGPDAWDDGAPLAPQRLHSPLDPRTTVEDAIQQDIPDRWITSRFVVGITGISVTGLALGILMFLLVPRTWLGKGEVFAGQVRSISRATTGVASEIRLGFLGRILESAEPVMEVRLYENDSSRERDRDKDKRVSLEDFAARQGLTEPLFRGNVFDVYEAGRWSNRDPESLTLTKYRSAEPGTIRQEYVLRPQASNVLFAMRPVSAGRLKPRGGLEIHNHTWVLSSRSEWRDRMEYVIYSRPFASRADAPATVGGGSKPWQFDELPYFADEELSNLELPRSGLEALKKLAASWTAPGNLRGSETMSVARRRALTIESRLKDSGEFNYSLNAEIRDPDRDPIEDFLFNRKEGHCEYFASALATMLRAVGVPARLVVGYKGAEPVNGGEYDEVQQRHAHAWVEAYFDGAWFVLDATPPGRAESVRSFGSNTVFWKSATSSLSALWATYVVSMSSNRQKETLYDPLTGTVAGGFGTFREAFDAVKDAADWIRQQFTSPGQLLTGTGALLLLGLAIALALGVALVRQAWHWSVRRNNVARGGSALSRWFGWLTGRWGSAPASQMIVEFYEKFLKLVGASGLRLQRHQTQREFAEQVERFFEEPLRSAGLTTLPRDVADLYYRARFGKIELPSSEISELDKRIGRLADALQSGNGFHRDAGQSRR
jgi:transglutaminase-like putative cysteine protease